MDKRRISYIVLAVVFTIAFVLIGAFIFSSSYLRLGETFVDLWHSIKFYFLHLNSFACLNNNFQHIALQNRKITCSIPPKQIL